MKNKKIREKILKYLENGKMDAAKLLDSVAKDFPNIDACEIRFEIWALSAAGDIVFSSGLKYLFLK